MKTFGDLVEDFSTFTGRENVCSAMPEGLLKAALGEKLSLKIRKEIKKIYSDRPATARLMASHAVSVMTYGVAEGYLKQADVMDKRTLLAGLKKPETEHHKALPWQELPELYGKLTENRSLSCMALRWIMLTGCRHNEALNLEWEDLDIGARVWTIPAEKTKTRTEHKVPITEPMMDVLAETGPARETVFGKKRGGTLSHMACLKMLKKISGVADISVHGFRSSLRQWLNDTYRDKVPFYIQEACLGHSDGGSAVIKAYLRERCTLEERRPLMEAWGKYLT